jgi:DeoR/GlpR family transcriptional regulator of sugar metabolism
MISQSAHKNLAPERQKRVLALIREREAVRVDELCDDLSVSPATIRRDLEALEANGSIQRVHGGAVFGGSLLDEPLFDDKTQVASEEKRKIAKQALHHVHSGATIYIDGGSTLLEFARLLHERSDVTIVTNSLKAALELSNASPRLILLGGELRRRSQTITGPLTRTLLDSISLDVAFMGTIGVTPEQITTTDPGEAYTKELVMSRSKRVVLLADSQKVGKVSFASAGKMEDIHFIISDRGVDPSFVRLMKKKGIGIELV